MFTLIGPHVRYFSDKIQTVCPTLKNKSWPPIIPKPKQNKNVFFKTIVKVLACWYEPLVISWFLGWQS
jgi:hypothetical protein